MEMTIYIEFTYSDGTKTISNCEQRYVDNVHSDGSKEVVSAYYSTMCDRSWVFGMADDGMDLYFDPAPTVTIDGNLDGSRSVAGIELGSGRLDNVNYIFTENCKEFKITDKGSYLTIDCNSLTFEGNIPPVMNLVSGYKITKLNAIYVPKDAIETYKATDGFFKENADKIMAIEPVADDYIDTINIEGVDYKIKDTSSQPEPVDAYTKEESDDRYAPKSEFASVSGDVENALGEIAALGIDKQDKLSGEYIYDGSGIEGSNLISFKRKNFKDGTSATNVNIGFKTINGQGIVGSGNIEIEGGGASAKEWKIGSILNVNNLELPFYSVNVGDIIIDTEQTAQGQSEDTSKYLVLSKYESPEDAVDPFSTNNYLVLIDAKDKKLIQLRISVNNSKQEYVWSSYICDQTNIGGDDIKPQTGSNGSSSSYIWSEGNSGSTDNRNAISKLYIWGSNNNGVNINTYYWGSNDIGETVNIPRATQWTDGVMPSNDKQKLDSIDVDNLVPKEEFASVSGDVENALGEIAALGIDKQDKLSGDYVKDVEIGGGYITFNSMKFDGNNNGVKTANFKTINNTSIIGTGNINIPSAGTDVIRNIGTAPLITYIETMTKSEYDSYLSKGKLNTNTLYIITE